MCRQLDRRAGPHQMTGWMIQRQQRGASLRRAKSLPGRAARVGPLLAGRRAIPSLLMSTHQVKLHLYTMHNMSAQLYQQRQTSLLNWLFTRVTGLPLSWQHTLTWFTTL